MFVSFKRPRLLTIFANLFVKFIGNNFTCSMFILLKLLATASKHLELEKLRNLVKLLHK